MNTIDLRSDTLTQPTSAMREAMANAEVGDDVFEEDPTLKKLEILSAKKTGKESKTENKFSIFWPATAPGNRSTHWKRPSIASRSFHCKKLFVMYRWKSR